MGSGICTQLFCSTDLCLLLSVLVDHLDSSVCTCMSTPYQKINQKSDQNGTLRKTQRKRERCIQELSVFAELSLQNLKCHGDSDPTNSLQLSTTGILTFSLKGHQSFHAFTSAFNVRWKVSKRMGRSERGRRRGWETGFRHRRRWGRTLSSTRSKRGKRPKQSVLGPRLEPWGTHFLLLSRTDSRFWVVHDIYTTPPLLHDCYTLVFIRNLVLNFA